MIYQGDTTAFILSLLKTDGTAPTITTAPTLQIINLSNDSAVLTTPATMVLVSGSTAIYKYLWAVPTGTLTGDYMVVVSYVADSVVFNGKFLEKIRVGDSRVTDVVAKDTTVAKDATVAKDLTVAHVVDLQTLSPDNSATVLAIKAKTDNLPTDPTSTTTLTAMTSIITDARDASLGNVFIDKTVNPNTLTIKRPDNTTLAVFTINDSSTLTSKEKQ